MVYVITSHLFIEVLVMRLVDELYSIIKKYVDGKEVTYYGKWRLSEIKENVVETEHILFLNNFNSDGLNTLLPGGLCIVIFPNRAWFEKNPEGKDWDEKNGEFRLIAWKFKEGRVWLRYVVPNKYDHEEDVEAKDPEGLEKMLSDTELENIRIISDVENEKYDEDHPWIVAIASKPVPKKVEEAQKEEIMPKMEETSVEYEIKVPDVIKLVWKDSNNKPHEMDISEDVIIGRGRGDVIMMLVGESRRPNPMMLFDPHKKISRRHIEIVRREDGWYIRDLGSTNGTTINGVILSGWKKPEGGKRFPSEYVKLEDDDEIVLANSVSFTVQIPETPKIEKGEEKILKERKESKEEKESESSLKGNLYISWVDGNLMKQEIPIEGTIQIGKDEKGIIRIITREKKMIPMGLIDREGEINEIHFEILKMGEKWFVRDMGSKGGTYLNGKPLEGWMPGVISEPVEIKDGDEILFGKYMITIKFK